MEHTEPEIDYNRGQCMEHGLRDQGMEFTAQEVDVNGQLIKEEPSTATLLSLDDSARNQNASPELSIQSVRSKHLSLEPGSVSTADPPESSGSIETTRCKQAWRPPSTPILDYLKTSCKTAKALEAYGIKGPGEVQVKQNRKSSAAYKGEIIPSNKGGLKYVYLGYQYTMKKSTKSYLYWICACRKKSKCHGSMRTSLDLVESKILNEHSHDPGSTAPRHTSPPNDTGRVYNQTQSENIPATLDSTHHSLHDIEFTRNMFVNQPPASTAINALRSQSVPETLLKGAIAARPCSTQSSAQTSAQTTKWNFQTLAVSTPEPFIAHVELNRPEKGNAMNLAFWREMVECFKMLGADSDIRAIVISGRGKIFTGGLDIKSMMGDVPEFFDTSIEVARRAKDLRKIIQDFQQSFTQIEQCPQPVIAAVHSACVGGGVDLSTACDIRYCSEDAYFQVKEVDIGLAADVGTLQRLPKIVGNESFAKEICYTARKVHSKEALQMGLVSRVLTDQQSCIASALVTAKLIAEKSPVAVQTTKESLNYSRDHPVPDSLNHVRLLNQVMLQSEDVLKAAQAMMNNEKPIYSKL